MEMRIPLELVEIDDKLLEDIRENGIKEPVEIRIRGDGSRILWDGLHMVAIAVKLGLETVPFFFKEM